MLYAVTVSRLSVCMSSATYVIAAKNCLLSGLYGI